jgi:hypothetical protein
MKLNIPATVAAISPSLAVLPAFASSDVCKSFNFS